MNDNSIRIDRYLQNEMDTTERAAFEQALLPDPALQHEFNVQKLIADTAFRAGLKASFVKEMRQKQVRGRVIKYGLVIAACIVGIVVFNFRQDIFSERLTDQNRNIAGVSQQSGTPFINPPLKNIDVPFSEYSFDAEKGDTLFMPSGSIICFPASALIDASGNLIKGRVDILYREFSDPMDLFLSGIPMGYDSAGKRYNFESSGMCEITASRDHKPVFVNPGVKPEVHLSVSNKSPLHNLYFLDTVKKQWNFMGKDQITEQPLLTVRNLIKRKAPMPATAANGIPAKPVMPMQASGNHQSLRIEIQPGSFQELFAYDGLKFEVINENAYLRTDANEEWEDVKLDRGPEEGTYIVTFTNAKRKVSYKVRPVLEGKDYEAALKIFNEKNKAYELALKNRLTNEKISDSINSKNKQLQMMADNEANNRIRALIIARNKRIIEEKQRRDLAVQESEIIRTFPITNFGVWNCDQPGVPNYIPVFAKYKNSAGDELSIQYAVTIYKNYNGYMPSPVPQTVRVVPGQDNMIWGIQDSVFYYFTYKDFAAANIQRDTRSFEFIMRRAGKKISSYAEIKELAEKL